MFVTKISFISAAIPQESKSDKKLLAWLPAPYKKRSDYGSVCRKGFTH